MNESISIPHANAEGEEKKWTSQVALTQNQRCGFRPEVWTSEEDALLRDLVKLHGNRNWLYISSLFPGRNDSQCRYRWTQQLNPALLRKPWTCEEDELLFSLHDIHGDRWSQIARLMPGRSSLAVRDRWDATTLKREKQDTLSYTCHWSSEEDELLRLIVAKQGPRKWSTIAAQIPGKSPQQCRRRWIYVLDPSVDLHHWTPDEDAQLLALYNTYGPRWTEIAKYLPGRTNRAVNHRWHATKKTRELPEAPSRLRWSKEEDSVLFSLVEQHGAKNWPFISSHLLGRNPAQCQRRWARILDPSLQNTSWAEAEDQALLRLHSVHGPKWKEISNLLPGRSSFACSRRYLVLQRDSSIRKLSSHEETSPMIDRMGMNNILDVADMLDCSISSTVSSDPSYIHSTIT